MARPSTGGRVEPRPTSKGEIVYSFLLRHGGQRLRITIGSDREGWTLERAEQKRDDIVSALRLGVALEDVIPQPAPKKPVKGGGEPTMADIIVDYLEDRRGAVAAKTYKHDEWACGHIGAFFAKHTPSEITVEEVDRFRRHKIRERDAIRARAEAGKPAMEIRRVTRQGRVVEWTQERRPLSNEQINRLLGDLATLIDVAMERSDVGLAVNAARGRRRRIPVKQVLQRSFLEPDQIRVLLEAAALTEQRAREHTGKRALPRKAIVAMLVMGALRISELCAARRRWLNLAARVFDNGDSKTAAGYREVDLLFDELIDILGDHLARTDGRPGDPLFAAWARSGHSREQLSPDNVRRMLDDVVQVANEICEERGIPPLGHCTPHALRRTNISLLCIATKGNLKYVMEQVGHTDPNLTLRIYAQLLKRQDAEQYRAAANELLGISPQDIASDAAHEVPDTVPADWSE